MMFKALRRLERCYAPGVVDSYDIEELQTRRLGFCGYQVGQVDPEIVKDEFALRIIDTPLDGF